MSSFTPVIIFILVLLIQALMRLSPNIFAIFEHSASANKTRRIADRAGLYFVFGSEITLALIYLLVFIALSFFFVSKTFVSKVFLWTMFGVLIAEAILSLFFYFKRKSTRLFITRRAANMLVKKAESTKNCKNMFLLGVITRLIELPFTLPLIFLAAFVTLSSASNGMLYTSAQPGINAPVLSCNFVFIVYLIVSILPIVFVYAYFHSGHNLADYQRLQTKTRAFTRIALFSCFTLAAILILNLGLMP
jgi:hypothetical protein